MKAKRSKEMNGVDHRFLDLGNGYVSTIEEKVKALLSEELDAKYEDRG